MRILLSALLVICLLGDAQASDIYLRKGPAPGPKEEAVPSPAPVPTPAPQVTPQPSAEDELDSILNPNKPKQFRNSTEYANAYYGNCIKQEHPILKGDDLKLLCGCTSVQFAEHMTPEQVQAMQEDSAEGQKQRNRMLMFVYTPCMQTPIRALILNECMTSTPNKFLMKDQPKTCACLADGVSADLQKEAPRVIEQSIRENPNAVDPLAVLLNSPEFEARQKYHATTCVQKYGVGGVGNFKGFFK